MQDEKESIIITPEEAGQRLDKLLANRYAPVCSRTYFQFLIEGQRVLLNGTPVKKRVKPEVGDEVEIEFLLTPELELTPEAIPLDILYEDDHILAINKPAGMVVHPAAGNWTGTFANALLYHCQGQFEKGDLRPGIVHRLDKETTGVLLAAKHSLAQQKMIELFSSRKIYKEYLAICVGNPGTGEIDAPIGRDPIHRKRMAVVEGRGRKAVSLYQTVATQGELSIVSIILVTGRTHQIRVHMKHRGTPILGDETYGNSKINKRYGASRQMLHAKVVRFEHPFTHDSIEIEAPLPKEMDERIKKIKG